jgi:hypothetical protein
LNANSDGARELVVKPRRSVIEDTVLVAFLLIAVVAVVVLTESLIASLIGDALSIL